ncbi:MAG: hypothetical protein ACFBQW_05450, partial [Sphingomonadaceae bacterium]
MGQFVAIRLITALLLAILGIVLARALDASFAGAILAVLIGVPAGVAGWAPQRPPPPPHPQNDRPRHP